MKTFTTNWYLYKTHLHPIFTKSQTRNSKTPTEEYTTKKEKIQVLKPQLKKTTNFEQLLAEAIDEGLALLGESPKEVIYYYLEETFKINRKDIPYRLEEFTKAIERIFGNGAKILKIQIMKCLFKKVNYTFKNYQRPMNLEFTEYIAAAKLAQNNYENKEQPRNSDNASRRKKKIICVQTR